VSGVGHLIMSGPVLLAIPVAAAAGAITFMSPCCLPLVPGYLSYLTGMSGTAVTQRREAADSEESLTPAGSAADLAGPGTLAVARAGALTPALAGGAGPAGTAAPAGAAAGRPCPIAAGADMAPRGRVMLGTLLFILGFSVIFALEGVAAASIGHALLSHEQVLTRVLGAVIIVLGLLFLGAFDRFSFAGRIVKPGFRPRAGLAGAPLLGMLFGIGWTPCIGPTLAAVLTLGMTSGTTLRGGLLAFVYALGLGVPFLIVAFAFQRGVNVFGFARRHARLITRIGGCMLIAVGLLEVTGTWASAIVWLQEHWLSSYTPPI
jgi:cytochrome c-type biogenesis protein